MQNYIGKQIDRYRIIDRLGMGGMAVVYKAYDTRLERDVALKLIRTGSIPQEQHERLFKRFEREAKSQAKFSHPNIVPVYDYGRVDGIPYLVIEYIPGKTLKERLHKSTNWRRSINYILPIADALAYAHQRGVIHRDVKPANILLDTDDQPILTDFGIAKVLETNEATLTGVGMGVGTPEYMAPEQWQGKASGATDQYALGVVLYELITGKKPYQADTPAAIAILQATEPLTPPSTLVNGVPMSLEKVLYKALARSPEDRYGDMHAFQSALEGLLKKSDAQETKITEKSQPLPLPIQYPVESVQNEGKTFDALNVTPGEGANAAVIKLRPKNRGLHWWMLWAGALVIGLLIIGLMSLISSNPTKIEKGNEELSSMHESKTPVVSLTPTKTITLSPTQTATIVITPTSTLGVGSTKVNQKDNAEMVYVAEGEFNLGSEESYALSREGPEHIVYVDTYWIYKYEVANSKYRLCIEAGMCDDDIENFPDNDLPAIFVDWYDAKTYCEWAGGRLPTEAEWEKAARGVYNTRFPWGNDVWCPVGGHDIPESDYDYIGCLDEGPAPIGGFPRGESPYGALDMAGNVWEWTYDWYSANYYINSPYENPNGPINGDQKVLRGGSWAYDYFHSRVSYRFFASPLHNSNEIGFRCVVESEP